MATTKKSTTIKKKTTKAKKPASKSIKSKSVKTNTKVLSKADSKKSIKTSANVTKKSKSKKDKKPWDIYKKFKVMNLVFALIYIVQGALIIGLSEKVYRSVTTNFLTKDTLASSDGNTVSAQATRVIFDANIAYWIAAALFIAAIIHIVQATIYKKKYEANLAEGVNKLRWVEYGLTGGLAVAIIALLSGVSDVAILELMVDMTIIAGLLELVMELYKRTTKKTSWLSYGTSVFSGLMPWVVIGIYVLGANKFGDGVIPRWLMITIGTVFAIVAVRAFVVMAHYRNKKFVNDYFKLEKFHMILGLVTVSALAWQVFAAILK